MPTLPEDSIANLPVLRRDMAVSIAPRAAVRRLGRPLTRDERIAIDSAVTATLRALEYGTRRVYLCPLCETVLGTTEGDQLACEAHGLVVQSWTSPLSNVLLAVVFDRLPTNAGEQILKALES